MHNCLSPSSSFRHSADMSQPPYFTVDLRILAYTWPAEPHLRLERLRCVRTCVVHKIGVAVGMLAYSGTNEGFQRQWAGRRVKVVISGLSRQDRDCPNKIGTVGRYASATYTAACFSCRVKLLRFATIFHDIGELHVIAHSWLV